MHEPLTNISSALEEIAHFRLPSLNGNLLLFIPEYQTLKEEFVKSLPSFLRKETNSVDMISTLCLFEIFLSNIKHLLNRA